MRQQVLLMVLLQCKALNSILLTVLLQGGGTLVYTVLQSSFLVKVHGLTLTFANSHA